MASSQRSDFEFRHFLQRLQISGKWPTKKSVKSPGAATCEKTDMAKKERLDNDKFQTPSPASQGLLVPSVVTHCCSQPFLVPSCSLGSWWNLWKVKGKAFRFRACFYFLFTAGFLTAMWSAIPTLAAMLLSTWWIVSSQTKPKRPFLPLVTFVQVFCHRSKRVTDIMVKIDGHCWIVWVRMIGIRRFRETSHTHTNNDGEIYIIPQI